MKSLSNPLPEIFTWTDKSGLPHAVFADAVLNFADDRSSEATEHPIEQGSDITDHVRIHPTRVTLELAHSNTPVEAVAGFMRKPADLRARKSLFKPTGLFLIHSAVGNAIASALGGAGAGAIKPYLMSAFAPNDRVLELHDALIQAWNTAALCKFTHKGRVYKDFLLTSVKLSWGKSDMAKFSLEAQEIHTVKTAITSLPSPTDLTAKPPVKLGPKPKTTPEAAEQEAIGDSVLQMLVDGGANILRGAIQ